MWRGDMASTFFLVCVVVIFSVAWFVLPQEFYASDPWDYSKLAYQIQDRFDFGDSTVFSQRLAVTLPVALLYKIFGVNIISTNAWPLLSALIIVLVVWLALPNKKSKILGLILVFFSTPLWVHSALLLPDLIAAAFLSLSTLALISRDRINPSAAGILTVASGFVAFLAKASAYWILPLWIFAFYQDVRGGGLREKRRGFYIAAALAGVLLGLIYPLICLQLWGDPLSRINALEDISGKHLWSWGNASNYVLLKRLTVEPVNLFLATYGAIFLLVPFAIVFCPTSLRYWSYHLCLCLAFFWFGSTSFIAYEPLPLAARMTLPALPAIVILIAYLVSRIPIKLALKRLDTSFAAGLVVIILVLPLVTHIVGVLKKPRAEMKAVALLKSKISEFANVPTLILTSDSRSAESLKFYFGYRYPDNVTVAQAREKMIIEDKYGDRIFVFQNLDRSSWLKKAYGEEHSDAEISSLSLRPLFERSDIKLYSINQRLVRELVRESKIKNLSNIVP